MYYTAEATKRCLDDIIDEVSVTHDAIMISNVDKTEAVVVSRELWEVAESLLYANGLHPKLERDDLPEAEA